MGVEVEFDDYEVVEQELVKHAGLFSHLERVSFPSSLQGDASESLDEVLPQLTWDGWSDD